MRPQQPAAGCREALARYVEAKDRTRPQAMAGALAAEAVLSFSFDNDDIRFPARVEGRDAIVRTLVTGFAETYRNCRTYYVCEAPPADAGTIVVPWLVLMAEPGAGATRTGHGWYRWQFPVPGGGPAAALHIHCVRMDRVADGDGRLLAACQDGLPYPWLPPQALQRHFAALAARWPLLAAFARPVPLPS